MAQILLDAFSDNLVGEMVEACRLSGVPLVVAVPKTMYLQRYLVGAAWDERHGKTCGDFSVDTIVLGGSSFEVAATLALRAQEGDVVITKGLLVAGMAMRRGATALSPLGREYDIDTIWYEVPSVSTYEPKGSYAIIGRKLASRGRPTGRPPFSCRSSRVVSHDLRIHRASSLLPGSGSSWMPTHSP